MAYHSVDIQWGNHDIVWMGAAAGSVACIANVVRISLRYNNMETLENGYGINLIPLVSFALDVYGDDPCTQFLPKLEDDPLRIDKMDETELLLLARMQKAITHHPVQTGGADHQAPPPLRYGGPPAPGQDRLRARRRAHW